MLISISFSRTLRRSIYQMGVLVYAQGEADDVAHRVRNAGKRLEVATLDLSGTIDSVRDRIDKLAARVRSLRREVCHAIRVA